MKFNLFKREKVEHNWKFVTNALTEDHKEKGSLYKCEDCGKFKHEFEPIE